MGRLGRRVSIAFVGVGRCCCNENDDDDDEWGGGGSGSSSIGGHDDRLGEVVKNEPASETNDGAVSADSACEKSERVDGDGTGFSRPRCGAVKTVVRIGPIRGTGSGPAKGMASSCLSIISW